MEMRESATGWGTQKGRGFAPLTCCCCRRARSTFAQQPPPRCDAQSLRSASAPPRHHEGAPGRTWPRGGGAATGGRLSLLRRERLRLLRRAQGPADLAAVGRVLGRRRWVLEQTAGPLPCLATRVHATQPGNALHSTAQSAPLRTGTTPGGPMTAPGPAWAVLLTQRADGRSGTHTRSGGGGGTGGVGLRSTAAAAAPPTKAPKVPRRSRSMVGVGAAPQKGRCWRRASLHRIEQSLRSPDVHAPERGRRRLR